MDGVALSRTMTDAQENNILDTDLQNHDSTRCCEGGNSYNVAQRASFFTGVYCNADYQLLRLDDVKHGYLKFQYALPMSFESSIRM
jgi:hypothetical protein